MGWHQTSVWCVKIVSDISATEVPHGEVMDPCPTRGSPAQSTDARKKSPHNIWL